MPRHDGLNTDDQRPRERGRGHLFGQTLTVARLSSGDTVLSRVVRVLESFTPDDTNLRVSSIAAEMVSDVATSPRYVVASS